MCCSLSHSSLGKQSANLLFIQVSAFYNRSMISLEVSLKHMAWSNQKFFSQIALMPDSVYEFKAAAGEWSVGQLLMHLVDSGEWYRYCLDGTMFSDRSPITSGTVTREMLTVIAELDQAMLDQVSLDDELLEIKEEKSSFHANRSLILSQAVAHTAEHKGQIATVLKQHGFHLDLDELDVWSYVSKTSGLDRDLLDRNV